ncbi:hypothetical protein GQ651_09725 [Alphaproteobacteria bacterium GH1-50]|uniref:Uncharacterized protein n=1 Tax=Kangsaoukella pontilimi TaxID=2691042 RepID=A0A7C9MW44_9RHOB|nr:hypothetical protein [Kangsaoukella pontilimi]MXQ08120.1 hypothetical protein [Kangsaoukella pontilimi]
MTENQKTAASAGTSDPLDKGEPSAKTQPEGHLDQAKKAAKAEAEETLENAWGTAEAHADAAKSGAARGLSDTAADVREAGSAFDPNSFAGIAADRLAENLSHAADAVRGVDLGSVQSDLSEFARRNPLMFFGGAAVLGFMAGRMLKASERNAVSTLPAPSIDNTRTTTRPTTGHEHGDWGAS